MYEIVNGLYLASFRDVLYAPDRDKYFIINCTPDLPMLGPRGIRVSILDDPYENERMLDFFPMTANLIRERLKAGDGVIVHCAAGQQRSAAVVAAYLIRENGWSAHHAMRYIKRRKSDAFINRPTFWPALDEWASLDYYIHGQ